MNFGPIFHDLLHSFGMFFRKGPKMKTCKFHCKLQYILKVGQNKQTWNSASKLSKSNVKTKWSKIVEFEVIFVFKMVPWGLSGRSQSLCWLPAGSLKASPGSLCASCLAPPGTPCEPLAPSRHCLGASKSYLGRWGAKHFVLGGFGTPNLIKNQQFVSHAFNTCYPYSPSPAANETSGWSY